MAHDVRAVANWFIRRARKDGYRLNLIMLQNLAYIAHGWHLVLLGRPLVDTPFVTRSYGPSHPLLWDALSWRGPRTIREEILDDNFPDRGGADSFCLEDSPGSQVTLEETEALLENVWEEYREVGERELFVDAAAGGSPWDEVSRGGRLEDREIPDDLIRQDFDQFVIVSGETA